MLSKYAGSLGGLIGGFLPFFSKKLAVQRLLN
jgi:hypothetical protein